ncbi:amidohydrolase family protein [Planomonospora sp. ID67723]|uniref:amidohydrolase n=1 Tax=Planomonospora sp. ID67723 TaxID=2738134 RepID=UPI0018C416B1|nr:amidohydrolase family protein [Planomonospora sp. ID67723]MBG0829464.1 amidohydrolase family protein [Planomonospora sp. ID67723]
MPSLLLRNARVGLGGPLRHVLISDGRVAEVSAEPPPCDESVDVGGGTLLPGLWDAHVHSEQWAQARRRVDLSPARSAKEAVELITAHAAASGITMGYGFRDGLWPDAPHKSLLEAAAPGRAVVLVSNDLHTAWFSPAALAVIGRGDHPTGVLREQDCYSAMAELPPPPEDELDRWVAEALTAAAARGVVGVLDFEFADNVTAWSRRVRHRRIDARVRCSIPKGRLEEAIGRGLRTGEPVAGSDGLLEVGPVKIFVDGSLNTRTAYCEDPYPGTGTRGLLETPPDELHATMALAAAHGIQPAVHAIGDLATGIALDAFERVGCPGRIEHAQLLRPADFARFARPGLIAGVQPAHAPDDREVADRHWHGRTGRAFAYAGLLAAGATLELGSDAPVAPLDPWDGIASAVERTDDERPPWHPEQAIPLPVALAAASRGRHGVRPGDPADLMITERDPAGLSGEELRRAPILGTLLGGRWTYRGAL